MAGEAKVLAVFGTRPEAIKLAPVIRALQAHPRFQTRVCVTAQHRQMLDQVLGLFHIRPHHDLDLMREDQSLFQITSRALDGLEGVLKEEHPDMVLFQGDTTTAMVAALAAFYLRIGTGHVEAGLRTQDKYNPFPEEMNRRLADALSDLCFAPTEAARQNLLKEGTPGERVFVTGNTVIDALQLVAEEQSSQDTQRRLEDEFQQRHGVPMDRRVLLVTGHRRESFGPDFESICRGLRSVAESNPDIRIVYPVHLNPNVQEPVNRILGDADRVHLIEPLEYSSLVWLMGRSYLVLTDSGGIQEEAPSLGKPVLVLRKVTERPEGVEAGVARVVGTDARSIHQETQRLLDDPQAYNKMARAVNPYGDGRASERIVDILERTILH